jgi:hypothetical protein
LKKVACFSTQKHGRQLTALKHHSTTTSPRFTVTLHHEIRKKPEKTVLPPHRKKTGTLTLKASDV